jgi:hypothetical protein
VNTGCDKGGSQEILLDKIMNYLHLRVELVLFVQLKNSAGKAVLLAARSES